MRPTPIVVAFVLFLPAGSFGNEPASCGVQPRSITGRSASGVPQVSNLALIGLDARVPRRSPPTSGVQHGLKVQAATYSIASDGRRVVVPSSVQGSGGGGDAKSERATFYIDIPIDPSERDAVIRRYVADVAQMAASSPKDRDRDLAPMLQSSLAVDSMRALFRQHRVGRYTVLCRIMDGSDLVAEASADLEVVFKGNFFEQDAFRK